jgi:hypothetical protein
VGLRTTAKRARVLLGPPSKIPTGGGPIRSLARVYPAGQIRRTFRYMTAAVVVAVSLFIILVISAVVTLVWRNRKATPADRYRRAIPDLLGGGIHPGGQPSSPPRPNNPPTQGAGG